MGSVKSMKIIRHDCQKCTLKHACPGPGGILTSSNFFKIHVQCMQPIDVTRIVFWTQNSDTQEYQLNMVSCTIFFMVLSRRVSCWSNVFFHALFFKFLLIYVCYLRCPPVNKEVQQQINKNEKLKLPVHKSFSSCVVAVSQLSHKLKTENQGAVSLFVLKVFLGNLYVRNQKRLCLQTTCILSYYLIQSRWSECTILSRVVRTSAIHIWSLKIYLHTIRPLGTIEKSKLTALYLPKLQHTNYSTLQNLLRTTIRGLVEPMVLVVQNYVDHTCTSVKRGGRTYLPYTCEEDGEIRHFDWRLICKGSPTNKKKKMEEVK